MNTQYHLEEQFDLSQKRSKNHLDAHIEKTVQDFYEKLIIQCVMYGYVTMSKEKEGKDRKMLVLVR